MSGEAIAQRTAAEMKQGRASARKTARETVRLEKLRQRRYDLDQQIKALTRKDPAEEGDTSNLVAPQKSKPFPIDESVRLPATVLEQAARANAYYFPPPLPPRLSIWQRVRAFLTL